MFDHFGQIGMMAVLLIGIHAFRQRAQAEKLRGDARRLRCALSMSLQALRKLYEANLVVLAGGRPPLIAGRNQINLLRTQYSRLTSLEEPQTEAVWRASIAAEAAETAMAVSGKALGTAGFIVPEEAEIRDMLESALRQACATLEAAETLLTPTEMPRDERTAEGAAVIPFATHPLRSKRRPLQPARTGASALPLRNYS